MTQRVADLEQTSRRFLGLRSHMECVQRNLPGHHRKTGLAIGTEFRQQGNLIRLHALFLLLMVAVFSATMVHAEAYVAGMVGSTFGATTSDVEFKDPLLPPGARSTDLDHDLAIAYGGKIGYAFDSLPWLGTEVEVYSSRPNIKQQVATVTIPNVGSATGTFPETDMRVTVIGLNTIVRYPHPTIQPYVGAGLGVFVAKFGDNQTSTAPGINALAGVRYKITEHVGVFAEYKYNRASFTMNPTNTALGFEMTYQAHHGMFGVSYHF